MCSARDNAALPTLGFPIRESADHWLFSASPRLIAAVHALHRLLVPRHPPCALTILTVILGEPCGSPGDTRVIGYCAVFKVREEASTVTREPGTVVQRATGSGRSLKTQQHARRPAGHEAELRARQVRSTCLVADALQKSAAELESSVTAILPASVPPVGEAP